MFVTICRKKASVTPLPSGGPGSGRLLDDDSSSDEEKRGVRDLVKSDNVGRSRASDVPELDAQNCS
jgi:hypothetical protein